MLIIDRIINDIVVLDNDGTMIEVSADLFTSPVKEGDVVEFFNDSYKVNDSETEKRRKMIIEKMKKMGLK